MLDWLNETSKNKLLDIQILTVLYKNFENEDIFIIKQNNN